MFSASSRRPERRPWPADRAGLASSSVSTRLRNPEAASAGCAGLVGVGRSDFSRPEQRQWERSCQIKIYMGRILHGMSPVGVCEYAKTRTAVGFARVVEI